MDKTSRRRVVMVVTGRREYGKHVILGCAMVIRRGVSLIIEYSRCIQGPI